MRFFVSVTRRNKAQQGATRRNKAQQGATRRNKVQQGATSVLFTSKKKNVNSCDLVKFRVNSCETKVDWCATILTINTKCYSNNIFYV